MTIRSEIENLIDRARELAAKADFASAEKVLAMAREQVGENAELGVRVDDAERVLAEERLRAAHLRRTLDEIADLIDQGRLLEADLALMGARANFGARRGLSELREHLDSRREERLEVRARGLIEEADRLAEAGDMESALGILDKARLVAPERRDTGEEALHQAFESREMIWSREITERGRHTALRTLERRFRSALDENRFADALAELKAAETKLGADDAFSGWRERLKRGKRKRIRERVHQAGMALEAERFGDAAQCLHEALELDPGNRWLTDQLVEVEERRRDASSGLTAHLRPLLDDARRAHAAGDLLRARLLIAQARQLAPDDPETRELAHQLDPS